MAAKKQEKASPPAKSKAPPAKKAEAKPPAAPPRPPPEPDSAAPPEARGPAKDRFAIVGIGASAGGLAALQEFFKALPIDSGIAFVVVPHLDPAHKSLMASLLSKHTAVPVDEATEGVRVEPNHAYIIPPNKELTIVDGQLHLTAPEAGHGLQLPIDFFLRSLAEDQQECAIGIILSGTGAHGSVGLKAVKARGGMTMAQEPQTAEFEQMPRAAIATGVVDYILPPGQMPQTLVDFLQHGYVSGLATIAEAPPDLLHRVTTLLKHRTKHDFRWYRRQMLARRIERRMGMTRINRLADYINFLTETPEEIDRLCHDLLISVTSFFRDPEAFAYLEQHVIPDIIRHKDPDSAIRIWVPACATGEEAYSIAMLFHEQLQAAQKRCRVQVFASDIDDSALTVARHGIYPESIRVDVSAERLKSFFISAADHNFQVNSKLRESVIFAPQNLISDPPFSRLDFISCRNLLIYLTTEIQEKIIALLHYALNEGGYLILGPSESIGRQTDLFDRVSKKWAIYRRLGLVAPGRIEFPIVAVEPRPVVHRQPSTPGLARPADYEQITRQLLLEGFAPASVLIDRQYRVLYFHGPTMRYLDQPTGAPTHDLMTLAREGLRAKLRSAIHKAARERAKVVIRDIRLQRNSHTFTAQATVTPVDSHPSLKGLLLVTFQDQVEPPAAPPAGKAAAGNEALVRQMDEELKTTREDLQATIEELGRSNEELKASNEEIMSMNEELQSANEELESSKEELQSLNEELSTVNNQLQAKVQELELVNNDMTNLLGSTDISTVFLGKDRRIRRFTAASNRCLNLLASDLGRHISDISPKFDDPHWLRDIDQVLNLPVAREKEVSCDGTWYLRRILPYVTSEDKIDGVVITFTDVTQLKKAAEATRRLAAVLHDSVDAITVRDLNGKITTWNRAAAEMYGYSEAEALSMNFDRLVAEDLRGDWEKQNELLRRGEGVPSLQTRRLTKSGKVLNVWLTLTVLRDEAGEPIGIATTERDVTEMVSSREHLEQRVKERTAQLEEANDDLIGEIIEHKQTTAALKRSQDVLQKAEALAHVGSFEWNLLKPEDSVWSDEAYRLLGRDPAEGVLPAEQMFDKYVHPEDRQRVKEVWQHSLKEGIPFRIENRIVRPDGTVRYVLGIGAPIATEGKVIRIIGTKVDITERKQEEERSRTLQNEIMEVARSEQQRIGQDLHDSVGQELTGMALMAEHLSEALTNKDGPEAELGKKIAKGIREVLGQVRALSKGLTPVDVDGGGLVSALRDLAARISEQFAVLCRFEAVDSVTIDDNNTATHLYRIAQEAVTNALVHGRAKNLTIGLEKNDGQVRLQITDDGKGFDERTASKDGMGLKIMRYRAELINAALDIQARDGTGTVVRCVLSKDSK
jgi:two-component system CheB/CheR fusion protein